MEYSRYPSMTVTGFLSQLGGLLGFGLGFSLLSAVEIIYWFVVVLGRRAACYGRTGVGDNDKERPETVNVAEYIPPLEMAGE